MNYIKIHDRLKNRNKRIYLLLLTLFVLLGVVGLYFSSAKSSDWIAIEPGTPPERKQLISGVLRPIIATDFVSPASGVIKSVSKNIGSFVQKGDLILEIDSPETFSQLVDAEINLLKARDEERFHSAGGHLLEFSNARKKYKDQIDDVSRSKKRLDESRELYAKGIISKNELENAELQYNNTLSTSEIAAVEFRAHSQKDPERIKRTYKLNLKMAEAKYQSLLAAKNGLKVYAAHNGIMYPPKKSTTQQLSTDILEVGRRVNQNDSLFTLVKNDQLKFQAELNRDSAIELSVGDAIDLISMNESSTLGVQAGLTRISIDSIGYKLAEAEKKDDNLGPSIIIEGLVKSSSAFYPYMRIMAYVYYNHREDIDRLTLFNIPQELILWKDGQAYVEVKTDLQPPMRSKPIILSLDKSTAWIGLNKMAGSVFYFKRPHD